MSRRVVLGKYNDGVTVGLRVSLPGVDALTGDSSDPGTFSFDSEWTDIAQIHQVSLVTYGSIVLWDSSSSNGFKTVWSSLGYKPFVETRLYTGGVIYDDYFPNASNPSYPYGSTANIVDSDLTALYVVNMSGSPSGQQMLTIIYKIPVPAP